MKKNHTQRLIISALCAALCIILPMAFHAIPNGGRIVLPMHIPVLICGLVCGWQYGLVCGAVGPLLSALLTGMPVYALLPSMMTELSVYGILTGVLISVVRTKWVYLNLYVSLIGAMLVGRIVAGITGALIFSAGNYSFTIWATSHFVTSLPGIAIQLIFIPSIVFALQKARVIPRRDCA